MVGCTIYLPNLGIFTRVHYRAENRQVGEVYGTANQKKHFILWSACQLATFEKVPIKNHTLTYPPTALPPPRLQIDILGRERAFLKVWSVFNDLLPSISQNNLSPRAINQNLRFKMENFASYFIKISWIINEMGLKVMLGAKTTLRVVLAPLRPSGSFWLHSML